MSMNLIVIGPQGSGKGEQATRLARELGFTYINMGDIFREIAREKGKCGRMVHEMINIKGQIVPDEFTFKVLKEVLEKKKTKKGFVFDGYPRTFPQLGKFEDYLKKKGEKIDKVFYLEVLPETSVTRLSSRRVCQACGKVYNLITNPSRRKGICDSCQGKLVRRVDDKPEVIRERLRTYQEQTQPLIAHFDKKGILEKIDGEASIEEVFAEIKKRLKD